MVPRGVLTLSPVLGVLFLVLPGALLPAQAPPGTDVFLAELSWVEGRLVVGSPVNLTDRPGYDNQPAFSPDGLAVLYSTIGAGGQADVCRIVLATRQRACGPPTPESEYSPTPMPGEGGGVSVVRVERDSTQRLWRMGDGAGGGREGGSEWEVLFPDLRPVGYHAWIDDDRVLAFVLGSPPTLQVADRRSGHARVVATNVGRSLHRMPGQAAMSFPARVDTTWWIARLDLETFEVRPLIQTPPGVQDHAWLPDGSVLAARGGRLYRWQAGGPAGWELVAVFREPGLQQITRLAVSPDGRRLALVGQEPAARP